MGFYGNTFLFKNSSLAEETNSVTAFSQTQTILTDKIGTSYYGINFQYSTEATTLRTLVYYTSSDLSSSVIAYSDGVWSDDNLKYITFTGYPQYVVVNGSMSSSSYLDTWIYTVADETIIPIDYLTTNVELKSVADAIRTKGGTSDQLSYPTGFVSAIENIPTGESDICRIIAEERTLLSEAYSPSVTAIGAGAFCGCALTTASFPLCTTIGNYAFYACSILTTASFPSCTIIGDAAFSSCDSLTTASFPLCTTIGSAVFNNCDSLTTASFPSCTTIGSYAFFACIGLTTASFPSCTIIWNAAFSSCYSLTTASFPLCTTIGNYAFYGCHNLTTISFPSCTTIGSYAFFTCSGLTTASFPLCTTIGSAAFSNCKSLKSLYLMSTSMVKLMASASKTFSTTTNFYVPSSLVATYKANANWKSYSAAIIGV